MPPSRKAAVGQRESAKIVLGARLWVHAAYCSLMLAILSTRFLGPGWTGSDKVVEGWGGAAGSVGSGQSHCPTWSRPRTDRISSVKGNTVISIDPRCFRNPFMDVHTFDTGLSPGLCKRMIAAAEAHGTSQGWGSVSDIGVKTYDIYIDKLGLAREDVLEINSFLSRLKTFIVQQFVDSNSTGRDGGINSAWQNYDYENAVSLKSLPFVIRYDASTDHKGLMAHKDNADVSFVVLLSDPDDFELVGGGKAATRFEAFGSVALQQGEAVVMNGQLVHESVPLANGRRYVLSGFTYMDAEYMDMKRRDTLVTMAYSH